jgi:hypothetical protein
MFGINPPEHLGTANIQPFRQFPPRPPLSLLPSWIAPAVCSVCHTRHAEMRATSRLAGHESGHLAATRGKKAHFCDRHHIASATAELACIWCRVCGGHSRCSSELSPANAGLLYVTQPVGSIPEEMGTHPTNGWGMGWDSRGWL